MLFLYITVKPKAKPPIIKKTIFSSIGKPAPSLQGGYIPPQFTSFVDTTASLAPLAIGAGGCEEVSADSKKTFNNKAITKNGAFRFFINSSYCKLQF